jgi:hypothetical protein
MFQMQAHNLIPTYLQFFMSRWHIHSRCKSTKQAISKKKVYWNSFTLFRGWKEWQNKSIDRQYLTSMCLYYTLKPATIGQTLLWSCECCRVWRQPCILLDFVYSHSEQQHARGTAHWRTSYVRERRRETRP